MSKELEERIACMKADLEAMEKELESRVLIHPYDWSGKERYYVSGNGSVKFIDTRAACSAITYASYKEEARKLARIDVITQCIRNLKKTLGCNWEFTSGTQNRFVYYIEKENKWVFGNDITANRGITYFKNKDDIERVVYYLNENYPNGWRLA